MLTEIYIEALLVDEELADQVPGLRGGRGKGTEKNSNETNRLEHLSREAGVFHGNLSINAYNKGVGNARGFALSCKPAKARFYTGPFVFQTSKQLNLMPR